MLRIWNLISSTEIVTWICPYDFIWAKNQVQKVCYAISYSVLTFKLLHNAGINQSDHQLVLTEYHDLKFETIKAALNQKVPMSFNIKEESAFLSHSGAYGCQYQRRYFPQVHADKSNSDTAIGSLGKLNPSFNGLIARGRFCDSRYWWINDYPHKLQNVLMTDDQTDTWKMETINIVLISTNFVSTVCFCGEDI